jgi:predicted nucleic acid-binding protein
VAYQVVLDADVIFPASLRDTLLRLAEVELFDPRWSERILEEAKRNVVESRSDISEADMDRMAAAMNGAFEDALVDETAIAQIEDSMENDLKDRHVLAAAVVAGASGIVTNNVGDFPLPACEPYGITVATADEFLCVLFDTDPEAVRDSVIRQAAALQNPPHSPAGVLAHLERAGAPVFAERVREVLP